MNKKVFGLLLVGMQVYGLLSGFGVCFFFFWMVLSENNVICLFLVCRKGIFRASW